MRKLLLLKAIALTAVLPSGSILSRIIIRLYASIACQTQPATYGLISVSIKLLRTAEVL